LRTLVASSACPTPTLPTAITITPKTRVTMTSISVKPPQFLRTGLTIVLRNRRFGVVGERHRVRSTGAVVACVLSVPYGSAAHVNIECARLGGLGGELDAGSHP